MRYLLVLGVVLCALALLGCGSNSAGGITGPDREQAAGSSGGNGMDENIIGPPVRTELSAGKPVRLPVDDPRDENIIGPPIYIDLE